MRNKEKILGELKIMNNSKFSKGKKNNEEITDKIEGRNAVLELLSSEKDVNKIFVQKG